MNLLLLPVPVISIFSFVLGFFVYMKNSKAMINRAFFSCCICVFVWFFLYSFMYSTNNEMIALLAGKIGYTGVLFVPAALFHFTVAFLDREKIKKFISIIYGVSCLFAILLHTTQFLIDKVNNFSWGYYLNAGLLQPIFIVFFIFVYIGCVLALFSSIKNKNIKGINRIKQRYISLAFFISLFAVIDFIPSYGIDVYPLGYIFIFSTLLLFAYTIVKYRFLDIRIAITRGAILTFVYVVIVGGPLLLAFIFRPWLILYFQQKWFYPPLALYSVLALFAPYIYLQLQNRAEQRRIREQRQLHQSLKAASKTTIEVQSMDKLSKIIPRYLIRLYGRLNNKITHISLFLLEKNKKTYILKSSAGENKLPEDTVINEDSYLVKWFTTIRDMLVDKGVLRAKEVEVLVYEEIDYWMARPLVLQTPFKGLDKILKQLKQTMESLKASVILPSVYQKELLGFLVLGEKTPEPYSASDIDTFSILANDSAMAFKAAQLFEDLKTTQARLMQSEKLNLLGQLASSMAHEINNPLAIISGNTQLLLMDEKDEEKKKLLKKINDQTERSYKIINRLLNFSRLPKEDIKDVEVNNLTDETLELVNHKILHSNIQLERNYNPIPFIKGNPTQIQEVLLNLFVNAIQAMPQGGRLKVFTRQLDSTVEVEITDTGKGIAKEDIPNIFDPFFTKGKEEGTGLGLFVADQIMKLHQGSIDVDSTPGKGTTFRLKFPIGR